jgi:hypothetical protein
MVPRLLIPGGRQMVKKFPFLMMFYYDEHKKPPLVHIDMRILKLRFGL